MPYTLRRAALLLVALSLLLAGCSSTAPNNTAFPYQIDRAKLQEKPLKRVIIASPNFNGEPTRYHLQKAATQIDNRVKAYLEANGYEVAPGYVFDNAWNQAIRTYGEFYDPTTGRVDVDTWRAVMVTTAQALREEGGIDGIVFTDLVEHDSAHNIGLDHLAQWYGVSRKPGFYSAGQNSVSDMDWNQTVKVASLHIAVFNIDLEAVFASRGGLDTLQVLDNKGSRTRYVRRKRLLDNDRHIQEGIEIAFHPLIPMKNYPGAGEK
jgi:hypothetical protein